MYHRNFQYVCRIHVVGNEMKWFTFLCVTLYNVRNNTSTAQMLN